MPEPLTRDVVEAMIFRAITEATERLRKDIRDGDEHQRQNSRTVGDGINAVMQVAQGAQQATDLLRLEVSTATRDIAQLRVDGAASLQAAVNQLKADIGVVASAGEDTKTSVSRMTKAVGTAAVSFALVLFQIRFGGK